jgi:hypothetical protein
VVVSRLCQAAYNDAEVFSKKHLLVYIALLNLSNGEGEKLHSESWKEVLKAFDKCQRA